jgi:hypothetical protein
MEDPSFAHALDLRETEDSSAMEMETVLSENMSLSDIEHTSD